MQRMVALTLAATTVFRRGTRGPVTANFVALGTAGANPPMQQ
jgi:hypothetical protein